MNINSFSPWIDKWGCIVTKLAVNANEHNADQEDSMHKAGHLMYWVKDMGFDGNLDPYQYFLYAGFRRHPMSEYTVSRDQFLPFSIGLCEQGFGFYKKIYDFARNCEIKKEKYAWLNPIRKLFLHTPNGDAIIQWHHRAAFLRATYTNTNSLYYVISKWLGDVFGLMVASYMATQKQDKHNINLILCLHFSATTEPTFLSKAAWRVYTWFHDPVEEYRMYFDNEYDPPIHKLVEEGLK